MYDQHVLPTTAPPIVAVLPSTGGEIVVQFAIAIATGMLVWGILYSFTAKGSSEA